MCLMYTYALYEVRISVSKIKTNRSEASVLHRNRILIPFTGIHLGKKKGTAHENLVLDVY